MHTTNLPTPSKTVARRSPRVVRHAQPTAGNPSRQCDPSQRSIPRGGSNARGGFTLTELLVVIAILAVLASLATVGIMGAMNTARQTRIKIETDNIDAALKTYKEQYGSYPPCNFDLTVPANLAAVRAHVARAFPRYNLSNLYNAAGPTGDLTQTGLDLTSFRPDQALVFWLRGFSPDITNPFRNAAGAQIVGGAVPNPTVIVKVTPLFEFDESRLVDLDPSDPLSFYPSYIPKGVKNNAPYVYFDGNSLTAAFTSGSDYPLAPWDPSVLPLVSNTGNVRAYFQDDNNNKVADIVAPPGVSDRFVNMDSFQLFSTGQDGRYSSIPLGVHPLYPEGTPFDEAYDDNVASFSDKARLGDAKP